MDNMFIGIALSTDNYDNLLIGWSSLELQIGVNFDAGNSIYSANAVTSRLVLTDTYSWTITDGGKVPATTAPRNLNGSYGNNEVALT